MTDAIERVFGRVVGPAGPRSPTPRVRAGQVDTGLEYGGGTSLPPRVSVQPWIMQKDGDTMIVTIDDVDYEVASSSVIRVVR